MRVRVLLSSSVLLAILVAPQTLIAQTNVPPGTLTSDTTWALSGSPFVISCGGVSVASGVMLTIEPAVVVKFQNASSSCGTYLIISGSLVVNGTVYFTSFLDDAVGGD